MSSEGSPSDRAGVGLFRKPARDRPRVEGCHQGLFMLSADIHPGAKSGERQKNGRKTESALRPKRSRVTKICLSRFAHTLHRNFDQREATEVLLEPGLRASYPSANHHHG